MHINQWMRHDAFYEHVLTLCFTYGTRSSHKPPYALFPFLSVGLLLEKSHILTLFDPKL